MYVNTANWRRTKEVVRSELLGRWLVPTGATQGGRWGEERREQYRKGPVRLLINEQGHQHVVTNTRTRKDTQFIHKRKKIDEPGEIPRSCKVSVLKVGINAETIVNKNNSISCMKKCKNENKIQ